MSNQQKALITGITGEIGSHLTEFLLSKGYEVHGIVRNPAVVSKYWYHHVYDNAILHKGDMRDRASLQEILVKVKPDEIYHLAANSHVHASWENTEDTLDTNHLGLVRLLDVIQKNGLIGSTRLLNMFGKVQILPINFSTPIAPTTPYATSKAAAFWSLHNHRTKHGTFAVTAVLFNHESPRRGTGFSTYLMAEAAAQVALGERELIEVGDPDLTRDWGNAVDGVECMWLCLQQNEPRDYIFATGKGHTVRDFMDTAFRSFGIRLRWEGHGCAEVAKMGDVDGKVVVRVDPEAYKANQQWSNRQVGDSSETLRILNWTPRFTFEETVEQMAKAAFVRGQTRQN